MCLLALAWRPEAAQPVVLVANRDEAHARPTAPLARFGEPPCWGGRDLLAGGTWLAVDERGRFGAVTNFRGAPAPADAPSRGTLIGRFLAGTAPPLAFLEQLAQDGARYAGFSLVLGDRHTLAYYGNRDPSGPRPLAPGLYALSNARLDEPWPKVVAARAALGARLAAGRADLASLLELLGDRTPASDPALPDTGIGRDAERRLSAAFVIGTDYGTRSTTAVVLDGRGGGEIAERCYDAGGRRTGEQHCRLGAGGGP